jgi:hypothetical protein
MSDDLSVALEQALNGIILQGQEDDEEITVPVGSTYQTGAGVVDRYQTLSQMQMNVLNWASNRSPEYTKFAKNMVDAGFLSESAMDQPTSAANNLEYAVQVFDAYRAGGGKMVFNEWFDWYSASARKQKGPEGGGPRATVTMASERDLRATVDAMASQVLGRAATDDEFQNALKQVREAERTEPTITTTGVGRTVTQSGLTAEGRSSIIQEALMQGPEAEDFGKATKMMDLFYSALEARPEGA